MKEPLTHYEKMKSKLRRWKIAFLLLGFFFIIYIYQSFIDDRQMLYFNLTDISNQSVGITNQLSSIPRDTENAYVHNNEHLRTLVNSFNREHQRISNHFNRFESKRLNQNKWLSIQSGSMTSAVDLIEFKHTNDHWSSIEEDILESMISSFYDYMRLMDEEKRHLNDIFKARAMFTSPRAVFHSIDVERMAKLQQEVNDLSCFYLLYHRHPEEVDMLSEQELEERLFNVLNLDDQEVEDTTFEVDHTLKTVNFTIYRDLSNIRGQINVYGFINEVYLGTPPDEGDLLSREVVDQQLKAFLEREYGPIDFVINDRGINYQKEGLDPERTQLYSYEVRPAINGYATKDSFIVHFNARTGNLVQLKGWYESSGGLLFDPSFYEVVTEGMLQPEEALTVYRNSFNNVTRSDYEYKETVVIWSEISGKFELAHTYTSGLYLNAHTGLKDNDADRGIIRTY